MPTASENRRALKLVTDTAVSAALAFLRSIDGAPSFRREVLLDGVPEIVAYYSLGTSALAADFYEDERERAGARGRFLAEPVILDRTEKIRRAIAWSADPLFEGNQADAEARLAEVVRFDVARPNRDTILENRRRDPQSVGWRRVASSDACKFCRMLADRGAVYREDTVRFAAHGKAENGSGGACQCTAWPVFRSNDDGVSASVVQYVASKKRRTPEQQARVREYLNENFPDAPG